MNGHGWHAARVNDGQTKSFIAGVRAVAMNLRTPLAGVLLCAAAPECNGKRRALVLCGPVFRSSALTTLASDATVCANENAVEMDDRAAQSRIMSHQRRRADWACATDPGSGTDARERCAGHDEGLGMCHQAALGLGGFQIPHSLRESLLHCLKKWFGVEDSEYKNEKFACVLRD